MTADQQRLAPPEDSRPQDRSDFNRLYHVCLLWVDYLRAKDEDQKQELLYDAASHLMHCWKVGAEGEEVFDQVWRAIHSRGRVYTKTHYGRAYIEAAKDGRFAMFTSVSDALYPVQEGIWQSTKGWRLEAYRVTDYDPFLYVRGLNVAFEEAPGQAAAADPARRHVHHDSDLVRALGPWTLIGQA